jgi:hypothetical protein
MTADFEMRAYVSLSTPGRDPRAKRKRQMQRTGERINEQRWRSEGRNEE